jgi:hypothetical protein
MGQLLLYLILSGAVTNERALAVRNESTVPIRGLLAVVDGYERRIPPVARGSVVVRAPGGAKGPWEIFRVRDDKRTHLASCDRMDDAPGRAGWNTLRLVAPDAGPTTDCVLVIEPRDWSAAQR